MNMTKNELQTYHSTVIFKKQSHTTHTVRYSDESISQVFSIQMVTILVSTSLFCFQANFSFFQRGSVQEFITFTSKILTERTEVGERQSVKEGEYSCHVYCRYNFKQRPSMDSNNGRPKLFVTRHWVILPPNFELCR